MSPLPRWLSPLRRGLVVACLLLGLGAAALTGGAGAAMAALAASGAVVGRLRGRVPGPHSLSRWRAANAAALFGCVVAGVAGAPLLLVGLGLVCWLQVHRAWTGDGASDDRVALLLTLLTVLLACILTTTSALGPLFAGLAVVGPGALLLCWLEGELREVPGTHPGDRGGLGGLWALPAAAAALTLAFFVALPRVQQTELGGRAGGAALAGFGESVEIGDLGAILDNPEAVFTARVTDGTGAAVSGPFYFRGVALDHFDGRGWRGSLGGQVRPQRGGLPTTPPERLLRQEITLEPISNGVLFAVAPVWTVRGAGDGLTLDTAGTWRTAMVGRAVQYEALSVREPPGAAPVRLPDDPSAAGHARNEAVALRAGLWTDLPPNLDPQIRQLATTLIRQAGEGASELERARHVADWLRGNLSYTLVPDPQSARQPLADFLFESRSGHCEYFATALAVLLRAQGTPARLVNGFYGGEPSALGDFTVVRQRDAHAWVEVWLDDGRGAPSWVRMDATPALEDRVAVGALQHLGDWLQRSWNQGVLEYDLDRQIDLGMRGIAAVQQATRPAGGPVASLPAWSSGAVALLGGGIVLVALSRLVRFLSGARRPVAPTGAVARRWRAGRRLALRRGWRVPESLPPVEAARWLRVRAGDGAAGLEALAWLHYRVRYGGEPDTVLAVEARAAFQSLRRLPRRRRA